MQKDNTLQLTNSAGLSFRFLNNGLIKDICVDPIKISLKSANPLGKFGTNLYLRKKGSSINYKALLGSYSNSCFSLDDASFHARGSWDGIDYVCILQLSEVDLAWQWSIELINNTTQTVELDIIYVQDVGLEPIVGGQKNEYYISQYIERRILCDQDHGSVICCRQNAAGSTGNPWLLIACKGEAIAASVDGMQLYGSSYTATELIEGLHADILPGEYAGESSIVAVQEKPFILPPSGSHVSEFIASYIPHHASATSIDDLERLPMLMLFFAREDFTQRLSKNFKPTSNIFTTAALFPAEDLTAGDLDRFFTTKRAQVEEQNGQLLSFFCAGNNHVVLRAKEALVERPHANIMQTHSSYVPNENIMSTTAFMYGVFNSQLTQGNTNFNRLLSVNSSQFNLETQTGQRVFVEIAGKMLRLGVPSAFEMGLNHCRWIYKYKKHCLQVRTWTSKATAQVNMDVKVLAGGKVNLLISHHFDADNNWSFGSGETAAEIIATPDPASIIATKFPQAQFRLVINSQTDNYQWTDGQTLYSSDKHDDTSFILMSVSDNIEFCMSFIGEVCSKTTAVQIKDPDEQWSKDCTNAQKFWQTLSCNMELGTQHKDLAIINDILPWYSVNALTHLLIPHGIEQFDGAAWGTRDTAQGPIELLLSMRKYAEVKQILRILFSNQNIDGGWPQWWMFDSYSSYRSDHSHGDIYHWCIIALSEYVKASGDGAFLQESLPYYHAGTEDVPPPTPLREHLSRLINMITASFVPGTALVPFGGGDWNDSMQPVSQDLARRLISSWTVEINYQAFMAYQEVCASVGDTTQSKQLLELCEQIKKDFNTHLIKDGVVAGHGLLEIDGSFDLLLHPSDSKTNIQYRLLPMIRGIISGIFTPEQAHQHLGLIEKHLKGPDGARLMNRPPKYRGGIQTIFKRAESSPYFGREIGIMYTHAHLRYTEVQARTGRGEAFIKALRQANPIAYRSIVPCGNIRQSNCYYSSSDVAFKNRYEADEKYAEVIAGKMPLKGGWRVYSSGPGIYIGLVVSHLLGLREAFGKVVIDPVLPRRMHGATSIIDFKDHKLHFLYKVISDDAGPKSIRINNVLVPFSRQHNPYRLGGALIPSNIFVSLLNKVENLIEVEL